MLEWPIKRPVPPAPGCRHAYYGTLYSVGHYGFSWTSSFAGTNVNNLYFIYSGINPNYARSRANGHPLRCLQE
ncbi:MAG: hypothetical protein K2G93_04480 [Rikenella sp.]|nr:hypothetical protein [Rikenella sp.]